mmetsp:Transcript_25308/g.52656  ORF Transcript_25308/g.52656 Transcript_25308/m.52656 type:complete len:364 (+) Transcript_25308:196-1287(+)
MPLPWYGVKHRNKKWLPIPWAPNRDIRKMTIASKNCFRMLPWAVPRRIIAKPPNYLLVLRVMINPNKVRIRTALSNPRTAIEQEEAVDSCPPSQKNKMRGRAMTMRRFGVRMPILLPRRLRPIRKNIACDNACATIPMVIFKTMKNRPIRPMMNGPNIPKPMANRPTPAQVCLEVARKNIMPIMAMVKWIGPVVVTLPVIGAAMPFAMKQIAPMKTDECKLRMMMRMLPPVTAKRVANPFFHVPVDRKRKERTMTTTAAVVRNEVSVANPNAVASRVTTTTPVPNPKMLPPWRANEICAMPLARVDSGMSKILPIGTSPIVTFLGIKKITLLTNTRRNDRNSTRKKVMAFENVEPEVTGPRGV